MQKLALFIAGIITPLVFLTAPTLAAGVNAVCSNPSAADSPVCQATGEDPLTGNNGIITRVVNVVSIIGGILAVIMIIVGGAMYMMARGDAGRAKLARETIIYALIGIVIILLAQAIVALAIGTT